MKRVVVDCRDVVLACKIGEDDIDMLLTGEIGSIPGCIVELGCYSTTTTVRGHSLCG